MSSQAEDKLLRMLAEGKITPEQFKELRVNAEQVTPAPIVQPPRWSKIVFMLSWFGLLVGIAGNIPFISGAAGAGLFISAYYVGILKTAFGPERDFRKMLLKYGFIICVIGIWAGLVLHQPFVWGLAIVGTLVGGYKLWRLSSLKGKES